jgi:hypothetical protein
LLPFYLPAIAFLEDIVPTNPITPVRIETTANKFCRKKLHAMHILIICPSLVKRKRYAPIAIAKT